MPPGPIFRAGVFLSHEGENCSCALPTVNTSINRKNKRCIIFIQISKQGIKSFGAKTTRNKKSPPKWEAFSTNKTNNYAVITIISAKAWIFCVLRAYSFGLYPSASI